MSRCVPQLKDVAREAKVSVATASIILRKAHGRFNDETKKRVYDAAKKLGWRRNLLVEGIQTGKSKTVGILIPPFDSYWTNVLTGIHMELTRSGYMPITLWVGDAENFADQGQGLEQIHQLIDRRVEALIVWPDFGFKYKNYFRKLIQKDIPLVVIDHELDGEKVADSVQTDEEQGGKLVAEHLLGLGHENIGCITEYETPARSWQLRRRRYFEFAVKLAADKSVRTWHMREDETDAVRLAKDILSSPDRPTAIFADTDHLALDIYNAAADLGISIPDELSVVGFSGLNFTASMRPPLTTVRQNAVEVGMHAGRITVQRINKEFTASPTTVKVACELIVRDSTAVAKPPG